MTVVIDQRLPGDHPARHMTTIHQSRSVPGGDQGTVVAARLCGGLGNQLFQFAAGRSLAQRCNARLILDATTFTLPQQRRAFALSPYPIDADVMFDGYAYSPTTRWVKLPRPRDMEYSTSLLDRVRYRLARGGGLLQRGYMQFSTLIDRMTGAAGLRVFAEKSFDYDCAFAMLGARIYLDGYWQSERYFVDVRDVLRRELTLPDAPNAANASWLARIEGASSVCVHVRRGDYLKADNLAQHGLCSADYYARAMRLVAARVESPQFFVFSDDLDWSRRHLAGPNVAFVDANAADAAHDELRLMATCRHHVIANSSLSWWGAWLAHHPGQIVVGPDPWFAARTQTPDLLPAGWIALPRG